MACKRLGANEVPSRGCSELNMFCSCMQFRRPELDSGSFFKFQFCVHSLICTKQAVPTEFRSFL